MRVAAQGGQVDPQRSWLDQTLHEVMNDDDEGVRSCHAVVWYYSSYRIISLTQTTSAAPSCRQSSSRMLPMSTVYSTGSPLAVPFGQYMTCASLRLPHVCVHRSTQPEEGESEYDDSSYNDEEGQAVVPSPASSEGFVDPSLASDGRETNGSEAGGCWNSKVASCADAPSWLQQLRSNVNARYKSGEARSTFDRLLHLLEPPAAALATAYSRIQRLVAAVGSYAQSKKGDGSHSIEVRGELCLVLYISAARDGTGTVTRSLSVNSTAPPA